MDVWKHEYQLAESSSFLTKAAKDLEGGILENPAQWFYNVMLPSVPFGKVCLWLLPTEMSRETAYISSASFWGP